MIKLQTNGQSTIEYVIMFVIVALVSLVFVTKIKERFIDGYANRTVQLMP